MYFRDMTWILILNDKVVIKRSSLVANGAWTADRSTKSAAFFGGESGLGPWQNQEIQVLLSHFVPAPTSLMPIVLPSAKTTPDVAMPLSVESPRETQTGIPLIKGIATIAFRY
jgi:hypothetical protein